MRQLITMLALPALCAFIGLRPTATLAHCDGMDGPVVTAGLAALDQGDVNLAMVWVQKTDEPEIRTAFERARAVRRLGPEAKELADLYFFETLVRIHRTGEGAAYTGLKPAGRDLGPAIPAADRALSTGKLEPLLKLLAEATQSGIHEQFEQARAAKSYRKEDVEAGRRYVALYVLFVHYVERVYQAARTPSLGHSPEGTHAGSHER